MTRRQSRLLATTTLAATLLWLLIAPAQTSMELAGTRALVDDDIEVVYQAPASTPRGVLLILHGCSHRATDAWPKSEKCPECTGLPIETRVVAAALRNRHGGCTMTVQLKTARWSLHYAAGRLPSNPFESDSGCGAGQQPTGRRKPRATAATASSALRPCARFLCSAPQDLLHFSCT